MENKLAVPGQELGIEEEFLSSRNTYLDNGVIRSTVFGKVLKENNKIEIEPVKAIDKLKMDMFVIGKVTDSVGSAVFVEIDDIKIANEEYLALTDGKIITRSKNDRDRNTEKPCGISDIVLARITDISDTYILDIFEHETGVVFSRCHICGRAMKVNGNVLECESCEYKTTKKISPLYMNIEEIKKFLNDKNIEILNRPSRSEGQNEENKDYRAHQENRHFRDRFMHKHENRGFRSRPYFRNPRNYNKV